MGEVGEEVFRLARQRAKVVYKWLEVQIRANATLSEWRDAIPEPAVGGVDLLPDEEPMIGKNIWAGDDHFLQDLLGGELGRSEGSGAPADGPDGVFDWH